MITLSDQEQEYMVKQILNDSIIFDRTSAAVNKMLQSFSPQAENWEVQDHFNSFIPAMRLMGCGEGISDERISDKLFKVYLEEYQGGYNLKSCELADNIFNRWRKILQ